MTVRNVKKSLAGMEDIVQGKGVETQTRNDTSISIRKIDTPYAVDTEVEMQALDIAKYTRARVYSSDTEYDDYIYDAAATVGVSSDTGAGFWVGTRSGTAKYFTTLAAAKSAKFLKAGQLVRIGDRGNALFDVISGIGTANTWDIVANDAGTLSLALVASATVIAAQVGAVGDASHVEGEDTGTDDYAALAQAIAVAENALSAVDVNPSTINTQNRNLAGGGTVVLESGKVYKVSDTLEVPARVVLDMNGAAIVPDKTATWTDIKGPIVDWVEVTAGGTGYTSAPTITLVGGGYTQVATAKAVISGGAVVGIYVTNGGEGYTSDPTSVTISGGGGAGATATAEQATIGQPLVKMVPPAGVFVPYTGGLRHGSLIPKRVCDGLLLQSAKNPTLEDITVFSGKYTGITHLGADIVEGRNVVVFDCGAYGVYGSYNWDATTSNTSNEVRYYGLSSLNGARACVYLAQGCSSWNIKGTFRQSVGDAPTGSEFIMYADHTGHQLEVKIEHDGANAKPSILVTGGTGYNINVNAAPNAHGVHFKWVHNLAGNNVRVSMYCSDTVMSDRVDNPNLANDISPFQSDSSGGLFIANVPYTSDTRLSSYYDWCRDMDGNNQGSQKNFLGALYRKGLGGGMLTKSIDLEGNAASFRVLKIYQAGDTEERVDVRADGAFALGDGTTSPADRGQLQLGLSLSSTQFNDAADTINTLGKFAGRSAWDTTLGVPLYADGSSTTSKWRKFSDDTIAYTPV